MTCHKAYLRLISVNYLRFQSSTNMKVKAHNEYHSESAQYIKALYPEPFQQEFGKIQKIARIRAAMKYFFNKITDM